HICRERKRYRSSCHSEPGHYRKLALEPGGARLHRLGVYDGPRATQSPACQRIARAAQSSVSVASSWRRHYDRLGECPDHVRWPSPGSDRGGHAGECTSTTECPSWCRHSHHNLCCILRQPIGPNHDGTAIKIWLRG